MQAGPFTTSARVYDLLYEAAGKEYAVEAEALHALIQTRRPGAASLLDVACGTGAHLLHMRRHYAVAGVDLAPTMLEAARRRHLTPGGVRVVDGWIRRQSWRDPGTMQVLSGRGDDLAAARLAVSRRDSVRTTLELHHLIGSGDGVEYRVEEHHLTLFDDQEYRDAFERAGLIVDVVASPHPERDRYVGVLP
jgi:hypothetical protein